MKYFPMIKKSLIALYRLLQAYGFQPLIFFRSLRFTHLYVKHILQYFQASQSLINDKLDLSFSHVSFRIWPILHEFKSTAGNFKGHYFHQDILVAKHIFLSKPAIHLDFGGKIDSFIAHLITFGQQIILGDIRPLSLTRYSIENIVLDLMSDSSLINTRYSSISCLHSIEHMGLGRYSDPVDPNGHIRAISNLAKLLANDGVLYLSVPIASCNRIDFNAHRVFQPSYFERVLQSCGLSVRDFALVDDNGDLHLSDDLTISALMPSLDYGCGIFLATHTSSRMSPRLFRDCF